MLRWGVVLMVCVLMICAYNNSYALADDPCVKQNRYTSDCALADSTGESDRGSATGNDQVTSDAPERSCSFNGLRIACTTALGWWSDLAQSWCQRLGTQPPKDDPAWGGNEDGAIFRCTRPAFDGTPDLAMTTLRWLPDTEEQSVDPEELAQRILARLELQAPEMALHPRGEEWPLSGVTGWKMWMWVEPESERQWGPISASDSEGGVTVTLSARVGSVEWDMGNGDTVRCGKGAVWSEARTNGGQNIASPDCGYMYESRGDYTVTATAHWVVEWTGGGQSGTIPLDLRREQAYEVVELQSVNIPVGG